MFKRMDRKIIAILRLFSFTNWPYVFIKVTPQTINVHDITKYQTLADTMLISHTFYEPLTITFAYMKVHAFNTFAEYNMHVVPF